MIFLISNLAMCEINAYNAYTYFTNRRDLIIRGHWKQQLSEALIRY